MNIKALKIRMNKLILTLIIVLLPATISLSIGQRTSLKTEHNKVYKSQDFGYLAMNKRADSIYIYKWPLTGIAEAKLVAKCKINFNNKKYMLISSGIPGGECIVNLKSVITESLDNDSVVVTFNLPIHKNLYEITIGNAFYTKSIETTYGRCKYQLKLKKQPFLFLDYLAIKKLANPSASEYSLGDYLSIESLNFINFNIRLNDADLQLDFPMFRDDIFDEWMIKDEFVLKENDYLIWRDRIFNPEY